MTKKPSIEELRRAEASLPKELQDFLAKHGQHLENATPDVLYAITRGVIASDILDDTAPRDMRKNLLRMLLTCEKHFALTTYPSRLLAEATEIGDVIEAISSISIESRGYYTRNLEFCRNMVVHLHDLRQKSPASPDVTQLGEQK